MQIELLDRRAWTARAELPTAIFECSFASRLGLPAINPLPATPP